MMEIRDPIHGPIDVSAAEKAVIEHPLVQRLRRIRQLGFSESTFPGATHTRFLHSLGTMHLAGRAFDAVAHDLSFVSAADLARSRATLRLAALLHDLGHPPFSHSGEALLPRFSELKMPSWEEEDRPLTHEEMSNVLLMRSSIKDVIHSAFANDGVDPLHVALVLSHKVKTDDPFRFGGLTILPLLQQLVVGELDVDRMDYLSRDSYFTGVAYGRFEQDWLLSNLGAHQVGDRMCLALDSRALFAFEDFLLSRYHMFAMVYSHHRTMAYQYMLARFLAEGGNDVRMPGDLTTFAQCDDDWLVSKMRHSEDQWARRIVEQRPLVLALEAWEDDAIALTKVRKALESDLPNACYWLDESIEVSRYDPTLRTPSSETPPLMIRVSHRATRQKVLPIGDCTDLFTRPSGKRHVLRLYCDEADMTKVEGALDRALPTLRGKDRG